MKEIFYTKHRQHLNSGGKESNEKDCYDYRVFVKQESGAYSGKWYTEEETDNQEHQALQERIDNSPEDENSECNSTPGVLDTIKVQDAEQKCDCENILDIVNKKSPKSPRRQPVTRNKDF